MQPATPSGWAHRSLLLAGASLLLLSACSLPLPSRSSYVRAVPREMPPVRPRTSEPDATPHTRLISARELPLDTTLDAFRRHAARHNPGLRSLYERWRAQAARVPQVRALPRPRFTYVEYLREVETRTGPQERSFGVSQSFPWFGTLSLRGSVEDERAAAAWQRFLAAQLALDHAVRTTYADYYALARSVTITRENVELLARLERVARRKLSAGADNHPHIIRLQVELGRTEDRLRTLLDRRRPVAARLNALLSRPGGTKIPWPTDLPADELHLDDEQISRHLAENNPELVALRHEVQSAALGRKLASKAYYPDFTVGVQTISTGGAGMPGTRNSGQDPWLLSFSVELPLWFQQYRAGEREAEAHWLAAREAHTDSANLLSADVELAQHRLRDARRRVSLYQNALIPKAEESLASTEASFAAGTSDFLDLIDAQRVLLEFRLVREEALAERQRAHAGLDRLLGRYVIGDPGGKDKS